MSEQPLSGSRFDWSAGSKVIFVMTVYRYTIGHYRRSREIHVVTLSGKGMECGCQIKFSLVAPPVDQLGGHNCLAIPLNCSDDSYESMSFKRKSGKK